MLEVLDGPDVDRTLCYERARPVVVGRAGDPDLDLQFLSDAAVSRRHVRLTVEGEEIALEVEEGASEVEIGGEARREARLSPGARFRMGHSLLRVRLEPGEAGPRFAPSVPRRRLAEFELGDELGRGSFGVVYQATDLVSGEQVALKLFQPDEQILRGSDLPMRAATERGVRYFLREMAIAGRLRHAGIVRTLGIGRDRENLLLAMELVEGGTLADQIELEGPLSERAVLEIGIDLLDALAYAHRRKVVHRDIKPGNVLLDVRHGRLHPKITDFGLARQMGAAELARLTQTGENRGSLAYISPEALTDAKRAGPASDVFSAGACLYTALTGGAWFGDVPGSPVGAITEGRLRPIESQREDLRSGLEDVIHAALARDPADRPPSAKAMADRLRACLGTVGGDAT